MLVLRHEETIEHQQLPMRLSGEATLEEKRDHPNQQHKDHDDYRLVSFDLYHEKAWKVHTQLVQHLDLMDL